MTGHGEKLSRKMEVFIASLLSEPSLAQAAQAAGIGEKTGRRWLHSPDFQERYAQARAEVVAVAVGRLQTLSALATTTLQGVMADPDCGATARVNAGKAVLEMTLRIAESEDLAARVSALEALAKQLLETIAYQRRFSPVPGNGYNPQTY